MRTFSTLASPIKTLILSASLAFGGAAGVLGVACVKGESLVPAAKAGQETRKVVINLKQGSNDLRAVSMALQLSTSLLDRGADVTIYANLEGVRLFDARQPDLSCAVGEESIGKLYERFVAGGGRVLVCPLCAETVGLEAGNLREGAKLGTMEQVADTMLAADMVIDY